MPHLESVPVNPVPGNSALDDCFMHGGQRLMLHTEAVALLQARAAPIVAREEINVEAALGRRIASPIMVISPVPAHINAAVDGFAFAYANYHGDTGDEFDVSGRATAGHPLVGHVNTGHAARIFTGAVMPVGTDTVVMQEDCNVSEARVQIPPGVKRGANVRMAGEDLAAGVELLPIGALIRPQDLAGLASIGVSQLTCFKRLRVAIVASGDEIASANAGVLKHGQVFDANTPMLQALIGLAGADVTSLGIWPDHRQTVEQRLAAAAEAFDVVLTTGGASRGDEDHMGAALAALGSRHFWQMAVKPGRPMMFGQIAKSADRLQPPCVVVGLPGNPVAVFVCFLMYVFPLLQRLGGGIWREPRRFRLPAVFDFSGRKPGRREFWRGMLVDTPTGLGVDKFVRDGSGLISGLRAADGLIDIAEDAGDVARGDHVDFIPFSEFGIRSS